MRQVEDSERKRLRREAPWTPERLARALEPGQEKELEVLVQVLLPVIHTRVARVLLQRGSSAGVREDVEDLTQEVFAQLLERDGRIIRKWRPELGLSLRNYVGLVADRRARSLLRSGRWTLWREQPTAMKHLESHMDPDAGPAHQMAQAQFFETLLRHASERLTPRGRLMLNLLILQERTVAEVAESTGMSPPSLYAWRSRLQKLLRELARELRVAESHCA